MTLAPGSRLGVYEVTELIGHGGMGAVYSAHDTRLGRDVAIKVLPDAFSRLWTASPASNVRRARWHP
jgi:serine/threonine protein kinase